MRPGTASFSFSGVFGGDFRGIAGPGPPRHRPDLVDVSAVGQPSRKRRPPLGLLTTGTVKRNVVRCDLVVNLGRIAQRGLFVGPDTRPPVRVGEGRHTSPKPL
jgi:hypothetical protein